VTSSIAGDTDSVAPLSAMTCRASMVMPLP
jgi:hypothetical protein